MRLAFIALAGVVTALFWVGHASLTGGRLPVFWVVLLAALCLPALAALGAWGWRRLRAQLRRDGPH